MKRKLTLILAMSLLASLFVAPAALAKDSNHATTWGDDCVKDDTERNSDSWTSDADYRLVVLKSSGGNKEFELVARGEVISTGTGKDISHIIMCGGTTDDPPTDG